VHEALGKWHSQFSTRLQKSKLPGQLLHQNGELENAEWQLVNVYTFPALAHSLIKVDI